MHNLFINFQLFLIKNKFSILKIFFFKIIGLNKLILKLDRVGLKPIKVIRVAIDDLYACRPIKCEMIPVIQKEKIDFLEKYFLNNNGVQDWRICNIMQVELFNKYLNNKMPNDLKKLDYWKWHNYLDKNGINNRTDDVIQIKIKKSIKLLNSIKNKGFIDYYLKNLPIVIKKPIINSRYNINHNIDGYEIYDGHHRVAAMCALKYKYVNVLLTEDIAKSSPFGISLIKINNNSY